MTTESHNGVHQVTPSSHAHNYLSRQCLFLLSVFCCCLLVHGCCFSFCYGGSVLLLVQLCLKVNSGDHISPHGVHRLHHGIQVKGQGWLTVNDCRFSSKQVPDLHTKPGGNGKGENNDNVCSCDTVLHNQKYLTIAKQSPWWQPNNLSARHSGSWWHITILSLATKD